MSAVVVVHGGAWAIPDELAKASVDGVKAAACEGFSVLKRGGRALDAVEAAGRSMEDNTVCNSGILYTVILTNMYCVYVCLSAQEPITDAHHPLY